MPSIRESLDALFDAERTARRLHADLVELPPADLISEIASASAEALARGDDSEASVRLTRMAMLLGDLEGERAVDLLIDILGSEVPDARIVAGEALESLAFDRWKEVALGVERAVVRLKGGSPALTELPFLLAEVAEPGVLKLIGRFLEHADAEAVAAGIEALAELGDPAAIPMLARLERDGRQVELDAEEPNGERVALGDLAHEARELLEEVAGATVEKGGRSDGGSAGRKPRR